MQPAARAAPATATLTREGPGDSPGRRPTLRGGERRWSSGWRQHRSAAVESIVGSVRVISSDSDGGKERDLDGISYRRCELWNGRRGLAGGGTDRPILPKVAGVRLISCSGQEFGASFQRRQVSCKMDNSCCKEEMVRHGLARGGQRRSKKKQEGGSATSVLHVKERILQHRRPSASAWVVGNWPREGEGGPQRATAPVGCLQRGQFSRRTTALSFLPPLLLPRHFFPRSVILLLSTFR